MTPNPQILLDFEGWKGSLEERQRRALDRQLSTAPDPEREKQTIQNIFWIAGQQGVKPGQVNSIYDNALGAHAVRSGWGPITDTAAFNARARQDAQQMQDETHLLQGMDGDTEEAAKAREASMISRAYWSAAEEAGGEPDKVPMRPFAERDAVRDFAAWQEEAKSQPGYSAKNAGRYWSQWQRAYSAGRQDLEIATIAARDTLAKIGDGTQADISPDAFKALLPRFRGMTEQQRQLAMQQIGKMAKSSGLTDGMGTGEKAVVATQRAIAAIESHLSQFALPFGARSDGKPLQEGDYVPFNIYNQVVENMGSGAKVDAYARPKLTAEQAAFMNAKASEAYTDRKVLNSLRDAATGKIGAIKKDSFLDFAVIGAAESAPTMALAAAGPVGFGVLFADYTVSARNELEKNGLTQQQAENLAPWVGVAQATLDRVQLGFLKKFPGIDKILNKYGTSAVTRFAGRVAATTAAETGVELAQDVVAPALVQEVGSWLDNTIPGVSGGQVWGDIVKAAPETFLSMLLLPLMGAGKAAMRDVKEANAFLRNPETLANFGFEPSEIAAVAMAAENGQGVQALRDIWGRKPREVQPAAAPDNSSVADGAQGEPATGAGSLPIETKPAGILLESSRPRENAREEVETLNREAGVREVRRGDDGWYLVTDDGKRIHAGTAEAADAIRRDLRRALTKKEANAYVAIADDIAASFAREGAKSEQRMTGDVVQVDGGQVTKRTADGAIEGITFDAATARNLDAQLQLLGATGGTIQGSNWVAQDGTKIITSNQTADGVLTLVHETAETRFRDIWKREGPGAATAAAAALRNTGLFDPARQRNAEDKAVAEAIAEIADGKADETKARETMVELVVANELGKRKDGSRFTPGALTDGVDAAIRAATSMDERRALGKFRAFLRAMKLYLRGVFATAAKLAKARRDGTLQEGDDFNAFADRLLGVDTQKQYEAAIYDEAKQYIPPTAEEEANGIAFSLSGGTALEAITERLSKIPRTPEEKLALSERLKKDLSGMGRAIAHNDGIADAVREVGVRKEASAKRRELEAKYLEQVESDFGDLSGSEFLAKVMNSPLLSSIFITGAGKFPKSQLMSRTRAEKYGRDTGGSYDGTDGIPSWMFGGNQAPDTMAQSLYEEGLLKEPSPDALWDAIRGELATAGAAKDRLAKYAERKREAREQAKTEAADWLADRMAKLPKLQAADKKAALVRAMTILDAILMAAPPEVRGKVGGFVALARLDTEKAREAFIIERIGKLEKVFEGYLKDQYSTRLAKLIERGMPSAKPGEKARGAIGPEGHRFFSAVSEVIGMTSAQVEAKQAELENELTRPREVGEADLTDAEAADIFEKQQILDLFGNLKDKNSAELARAYDAATSVYKKGRNRWRTIEEARLAEVRSIGDAVINALGGTGYKAIQGSKAKARGIGAKINAKRLELKNLGGFLREILGEGNEIAARWTKSARDGMKFTENARRKLKDEWKSVVESATGKKGRTARLAVWGMVQKQSIDVVLAGAAKTSTRSVPESVLESIMDGTIDPRDVGLTRAQADALIGQDAGRPLEVKDTTRGPSENVKLSEAEGVFITMLAAQEQYQKGLDAAGFTGDAIAAIEESLSDAAKALRSWMRGKYADNYNALNSVFSRMFGVDLAQIKNYAPAAFYHTGDANAKGPEDSTMQEGGFRSNFLKTRKKHRAAPRLENAFATFFGHAAQSAHWQGFAELVREMRGVMARPDVKMAMEGRHGREVAGLMSDWLKNIEGNGISRAHGAWDAFTGWLLRQAAYVHLAYNVGTLVVQSTAALGSAWKIGAGSYMRGLAKLMAGRLDVKAMWNSDLIQNRLANGYAPEVRAALNDLWSAKPSLRQDFLEKGMELIGFADAFWTTASAAIAYDAHYKDAIAAGMSEESAKAIAMARTEETVGETAQPSTVTEKSLFEAKNGNLAKLAFLYASEARQKTSLLVDAWKNSLTGKATRQDYQVLILAHLVIGPAIQFMRAALRDMKDHDDEELFDKKHWQKPMEWVRAIMLGPLNGIPLVGDLFSGYSSDNAAVGRYKEAGASAISLLKGPEAGTAEKGEWYWNHVVRVLKGMDAATAVGAGIADQVFKTADNFSE